MKIKIIGLLLLIVNQAHASDYYAIKGAGENISYGLYALSVSIVVTGLYIGHCIKKNN